MPEVSVALAPVLAAVNANPPRSLKTHTATRMKVVNSHARVSHVNQRGGGGPRKVLATPPSSYSSNAIWQDRSSREVSCKLTPGRAFWILRSTTGTLDQAMPARSVRVSRRRRGVDQCRGSSEPRINCVSFMPCLLHRQASTMSGCTCRRLQERSPCVSRWRPLNLQYHCSRIHSHKSNLQGRGARIGAHLRGEHVAVAGPRWLRFSACFFLLSYAHLHRTRHVKRV